MAKKFLVNIDLGSNQLLNALVATGSIIKASAKIDPQSSAPSAAGAGSLYYNTTSNTLWYATGSGTGNWVQVATGSSVVSSLNSITGAITLSGTTDQVVVTNGSGTITLSLPQSINTTSKPQFAAIGIGTSAPTAGLTVSGGKTTLAATASGYAGLNMTGTVDPSAPVSGDIWNNTGALKFYNGTATKTLAFTDSNITGTAAGLSATLAIASGGTNGTATPTAGAIAYGTGTAYAFSSAGTSGQVLTSAGTGTPTWTSQSSLTVGTATNSTNATNVGTTNDTTTSTAQYLTWVGATSGNNPISVSSTKLTFTPSTGTLAATVFSGSGASLTSIPNSATTATSANTNSAIVARDSSGNFSAGTITATLSGNASTATALQTARTINGTSFDGTANITVTAAAGTLTGTTLNSTVVNSSLTSVGTLSGLTATGTVNLGGATTVTVPTPVNATDAANKQYVDNVSQGVNAHDAVQYATTTTIAGTYSAGTTGADGGTGVGATITFTSTGTTTIDGGSTLALNDRILVKNGVTADSGTASKANGIYYVSTAGSVGVATVLTRALDADNSIAGDITAGDLVYIIGGGQGGTQWIQTATGTATTPNKGIKIGTDGITFTQFSGASSTTAGAGLVANGNAFDVGTASTSRIVVNADNIDLATVSVGTTGSGTASGSVVQSVTVDSYGRVTNVATGTHTLAAADGTTKGIAAFNGTRFTATSGVVDIATGSIGNTYLTNSTISGISLGSNLATLTIGTGLSGTSYNGSTGVTIGFATGTTTQTGTGVSGGSYTYATQKQTATITGDNTTSSFTVNHNLASRDVQVQVYQTSATPDTQYAEVEVDIVRATTSTVTVAFATAPATGITYNVVIVG